MSASLKCQLKCIMHSEWLNNAEIYYHCDTGDEGESGDRSGYHGDSGDQGDSCDDADKGHSGDQGDSAQHGGSPNDGHNVYIMYRQ